MKIIREGKRVQFRLYCPVCNAIFIADSRELKKRTFTRYSIPVDGRTPEDVLRAHSRTYEGRIINCPCCGEEIEAKDDSVIFPDITPEECPPRPDPNVNCHSE